MTNAMSRHDITGTFHYHHDHLELCMGDISEHPNASKTLPPKMTVAMLNSFISFLTDVIPPWLQNLCKGMKVVVGV